jgi:hypothetical protein
MTAAPASKAAELLEFGFQRNCWIRTRALDGWVFIVTYQGKPREYVQVAFRTTKPPPPT